MDWEDLEIQPITHNESLVEREPPEVDEGEELALLVQVKTCTLSWDKQAMRKHMAHDALTHAHAALKAEKQQLQQAHDRLVKQDRDRWASEAKRLREEFSGGACVKEAAARREKAMAAFRIFDRDNSGEWVAGAGGRGSH